MEAGFNVVLVGIVVVTTCETEVDGATDTVDVVATAGAHSADTCATAVVAVAAVVVLTAGTVVDTTAGWVDVDDPGTVVRTGAGTVVVTTTGTVVETVGGTDVVVVVHSGNAALRVLSASEFPPHAETNRSTTKQIFNLTSR